jgi:ABC-type sugar transport system permease subunit
VNPAGEPVIVVEHERAGSATPDRRPARKRRRKATTVKVGYLYVLPALVVFGMFIAFPFGFAVWLSFHSWDGFTSLSAAPFVGAANYHQALGDPIFHKALLDTVLFTVVSTVAQMAIAFLLAFTLWHFKLRFAGAFRALYFFPAVLSMIVVGIAWRQLLATGGPIASGLTAAHVSAIPWLGSTNLVMWVIIWVSTWQWSGWTMILYLAGMVGLPQDVIEAARIDGASSFVTMRSVVAPMLRHVTALALLLNVVGGFQVFDTIYVMTGGGPDHASETLGSYSWWVAFSSYGPGELGYAATIAVIMICVLFVFSYFRIRVSRLV